MYSNLFTIKELSSVRQWYRLVIRRLKPRRTDTVRVARQSLHGSSTTWFQTPCCRPKLKSDLIRSIKTDTVVERRLKQTFSNFLYVPSDGCFQPPKWLIMNFILNLWEESSLKKERKKERKTARNAVLGLKDEVTNSFFRVLDYRESSRGSWVGVSFKVTQRSLCKTSAAPAKWKPAETYILYLLGIVRFFNLSCFKHHVSRFPDFQRVKI